MTETDTFSVRNLTRQEPSRLPYRKLKEQVLGKRYALSLVFVGDTRSRTLNKRYRNKNKPANVLAFPLEQTAGEIFLNLNRAKIDAPKFDAKPRIFTARLFIHAMLHLKGYRHGRTMDTIERKIAASLHLKK